MIQLANDPNASRSFPRAAANDGKPDGDGRRARSAHAWPFLSPYSARPARQDNPDKPAANDNSGS
ncbi:hypothetical protein [Ramlibacter sp. PS4R-6]|uniref:hypothetical protein n=1 Tax=Ramlibacter sp. PS4R-6 TaxID=3133438 RepID=UPI00309FF63B